MGGLCRRSFPAACCPGALGGGCAFAHSDSVPATAGSSSCLCILQGDMRCLPRRHGKAAAHAASTHLHAAQRCNAGSQSRYCAVGVIWLGVFFWWGSSWVGAAGRRSARYTFWLTISLLAALDFALQLGVQIVYIRNVHHPPWLAILGFPPKPSLQKLQARCSDDPPCRMPGVRASNT